MSDVMLAPLSTLWSAMSPMRPAAPPPVDVGAIAAAAEAQGFARGRAEAEVALAPALAVLAGAVAALEAALVIDPQALHPLFVDLVTRIASAVVDGELRQSHEVVERLVTEALAAVEGGGEPTLHLCADDAAHFRHSRMFRHPRAGGDPSARHSVVMGPRLRGDDGEGNDDDETVTHFPRIVVDPDLSDGDVRVETIAHVVAASLDARLAAIVGAL